MELIGSGVFVQTKHKYGRSDEEYSALVGQPKADRHVKTLRTQTKLKQI